MDDFSDDDLDGLGEDDLLALDDDVVSAQPTQAFSHPVTAYASQPTGLHAQQGANGNGHRGGIDQQNVNNPVPNEQPAYYPDASYPSQEPGPSTQREQWRQQRYADTTPGLNRTISGGNLNLPHRAPFGIPKQAPQITPSAQRNYVNGNDQAQDEVAKLRAELEQARVEKLRLQTAAKSANDQMLAKAGEISILRSNQAKTAQEYEKRIEELHNRHVLDKEKHAAEIEQSKKEQERLASHNQFLNHERNDDSWQLRQGQKSVIRETKRTAGDTPKKHKPAHFGDGFDDDEVMIISPSKSATRSKTTTPRGGLKRKRDALADSPLKPLELSQSLGALPDNDTYIPPLDDVNQSPIKQQKPDESFQLLQRFLNRQVDRGGKRTYEVLSQYMLPSNPRVTLSTILTNDMSLLSRNTMSEDFSSATGHVILSLWSRCLDEKYHKPLRYLLDLVEFILFECSPAALANLVDEVVDLAQRTADVNIIPRYKRFKRKTVQDDPDARSLDEDISTRDCLELLDLTITLCNRDQELNKRFWRSMRFDFISMLLRNSQDVEDVTLMAKILARSVRSDTFAMIIAPPASQSASEQHVIDRLSSMLVELPRVLEGEHQPDAVETAAMRLEILSLIETMCSKQYCAEAFAKHPAALGRLVRVMHDELGALYNYKYGHSSRAQLVNRATRLLYQITNDYSNAVGNFQEKLRTAPTSVHKHLIVLSRLAFSEGIVLEAEIEDDVLDMAHQMLEEQLTLEEGEALQKAFVKESQRTTAQMSG